MHRSLLAASLAFLVTAPALAADPVGVLGAFKSDSSGVLPPHVKVPGQVLRTIAWSDGKGDNLAVFSTTSSSKTKGERTFHSKSIFVDVFTGKNGKLKKAKSIREVAERCEYDLMNEFLDKSVGVTDVDKNGVGELVFAYRTACRSDMSPADMKLLVLEGPKKYILRGSTRLRPGPEGTVGGEFTPDFKGAPAGFLEFATKVWDKFVAE